MKVQRIGLGLLVFLLTACGNQTLDSILGRGNTNDKITDPFLCDGSRLVKNRFIVNWKNGKTTVEHSENLELFKRKFLTPRMHEIQTAEYDVMVELKDYQTHSIISAIDSQSWGQNLTEVQAVWNQGIYGQGVKVGVVDAAIDYRHAQINPRLDQNHPEINGSNGRDDDGNGLVDDLYGWDFYQNIPDPRNIVNLQNTHGTHVSGIVLADHSKGQMRGIAPQATLVPANFMSANGSGSLGAGIAALKYVASRGARVINASWGGPGCSESLRSTISALANSNVLVVVAAGNDGLDLDRTPDYPASFNLGNQLNVGASNRNNYLTTWSNSSYNFVHIAAPGDEIFSTVYGGYAYMSGTSMAAPFVSGAAALLWSVKPNAHYSQIRQALLNSVDVHNMRVSSQGRMNVRKAVDEIRRLVP